MNRSTLEVNEGNDSMHRIFATSVFGTVAVLSIAGNAFCLVVLNRARHLNTPTKLFLKSLTIADLCIGLFCTIPHTIISAIGHTLSEELFQKYCLLTNMASVILYIGSTLSLLFVNIDRYLAIEYPLKYMKIVTIRKARSMLFCLWNFNCVVLLTLALLFLQGTFKNDFESCGPFIDDFDPEYITFISIYLILFSIVPFVVTVSIYGRILFIVRRHKKMETRLFETTHISATTQTQRTYRRTDRKAVNTFLMITLISSAIWIPFFLFTYFGSFLGSSYPFVKTMVHSIGLSICWINILIYTIRDRSFRKTGMEIIRH